MFGQVIKHVIKYCKKIDQRFMCGAVRTRKYCYFVKSHGDDMGQYG